MIRTAKVVFCDNEHGNGDVCFPDLTTLSRFEIQQAIIDGLAPGGLWRAAKAAGWGRVNGGHYCPACMESMEEAAR